MTTVCTVKNNTCGAYAPSRGTESKFKERETNGSDSPGCRGDGNKEERKLRSRAPAFLQLQAEAWARRSRAIHIAQDGRATIGSVKGTPSKAPPSFRVEPALCWALQLWHLAEWDPFIHRMDFRGGGKQRYYFFYFWFKKKRGGLKGKLSSLSWLN